MNVTPINSRERGFTLAVDLLGMVVFSSFVSSITAKMTGLRMLKSDMIKQEDELRRLFRQNRVSLETSKAIYEFVRRVSWYAEFVKAKEISLVKNLPDDLQRKLLQEIYKPRLAVHPFFCMLARNDGDFVASFASTALEERAVERQDKVFARQDVASHMIVVERGTMRYSRLGLSKLLEKPEWVCEPALWISGWISRGVMHAQCSGALLLVSVDMFRERLSETDLDSAVRKITCSYAASFVNAGSRDDQPIVSLSDLWLSKMEVSALARDAMLANG